MMWHWTALTIFFEVKLRRLIGDELIALIFSVKYVHDERK